MPAVSFFFFQAEDGIRDLTVTGVQTCALPILSCHTHSTTCARPVAANGWPRPLSPPEGLTGRRPSSAVSPSSVARPALPGGTRPRSSSEISSNGANRSEEHTSELQSQSNLVCRLLLEKKKKKKRCVDRKSNKIV